MENNINNKEVYYENLVKIVEYANYGNYYTEMFPFIIGIGLPDVEYEGLFTQPNETIIYVANAECFEDKEETVGYSSGYAGASVRVAKGLTVHAGGRKGAPIRDFVRDSNYGDYIVTNKRVIFISQDSSFEIALDKINSITDDGSNEIYIHTSRKTKNIEFTKNIFKYALELTKFAINTFNNNINIDIYSNELYEKIPYEEYSIINSIVENHLGNTLKDKDSNTLNSVDSKVVNEIYDFLINNSLVKGMEYKLASETTFMDSILHIFNILKSLRSLEHIHFYDENETETLADDEFLEKYSFFEEIDFEKDIIPYIKKDIMCIFSIISFLRNTKNTTTIVDLVKGSNLNTVSPFDSFLNKEKNKWVEHNEDIENYFTTSLQYYLKNLNSFNVGPHYEKSIYKSLKINDSQNKYIPYENKEKIDFKDKCSYEEFERELTTFYTFSQLNPDVEFAIEQYLMLHYKYLYNFVKTHKELKNRYDLMKKGIYKVDKVFNFLQENVAREWLILKNVSFDEFSFDILIINKHGVFVFDLIDSDNKNFNRKENGDEAKKIATKFRNEISIFSKYLEENYPKEGFLFKKKAKINWNEAIRGVALELNSETGVDNEFGIPVVNLNDLQAYLKDYSIEFLDSKQIKNIENILSNVSDKNAKKEYPVHFIKGYEVDNLSKLELSSGVFFNDYLINLGFYEFSMTEFMNLGQSLTFCPVYRNKKNKTKLDFVKVKECECFIQSFFKETDFERSEKLRTEFLKFAVEILGLDKRILNLN